MSADVILAIDGGATRTRCVVVDRAAHVLGEGQGGPANHLLVEAACVQRSLADAIAGALTAARVSWADVRCVAAGLAGVDYDETGADTARRLLPGVGRAVLSIAGDIVIAHVAALDDRPGVMALAGTGSAILGVDGDGRRVKAGGWGPVFGNEGSAYEIGRSALVAAARAYDGTGPATALGEAVRARLGLGDFRESIARVYGGFHGGAVAPHEIAALASLVTDAADAGDPAADAILARAGEDLAAAVVAVLGRLRLEEASCPVSYQGSVLRRCARVRSAFVQSLAARASHARVQPPRHSAVMGAYMLGCRALGWSRDRTQTHRTASPRIADGGSPLTSEEHE